MDNSLAAIEEDIILVLALKREKKRRARNGERRSQKRGRYKKLIQHFTDPETGVCSVVTSKHTVLYQCYILHPNPTCQK